MRLTFLYPHIVTTDFFICNTVIEYFIMSSILEITELGNSILRETAKEVKNIDDYEIQKLIDNMILTVEKVNGVGLAAPQVNKNLRIFVMSPGPNPRYPDASYMAPQEIINPHITNRSTDIESIDWEGCLSIPGIRGLVPRHREIQVRYLNRHGEEKFDILSDFIARIFQHELDHLNGLVFLDRIRSNKDIITENEYIKLLKVKERQ